MEEIALSKTPVERRAISPVAAQTKLFQHGSHLRGLCRRRFPANEQLANAALGYVLERLCANGCERLIAWQGNSSFCAFLTTTTWHLINEFSRKKFGGERKPAWLTGKASSIWETAYYLLSVEPYLPREVGDCLQAAHPRVEFNFIANVVATIRGRRQACSPAPVLQVDCATLQLSAGLEVDDTLRLQRGEVLEVLRLYLCRITDFDVLKQPRLRQLARRLYPHLHLNDEDRLLMRMRYVDGLGVQFSAGLLHLRGDPYKRCRRIINQLRQALRRAGRARAARGDGGDPMAYRTILGRCQALYRRLRGRGTVAAEPYACPTDEDLAAYIDGCLSRGEGRQMAVHFSHCGPCYQRWLGVAVYLADNAAAGREPRLSGRSGLRGSAAGVARRALVRWGAFGAVGAAVILLALWPAPGDLGRHIDYQYETVLAARWAALPVAMTRAPLPWEGPAARAAQGVPAVRAVHAGLWRGWAQLAGPLAAPPALRAPADVSWTSSEWAPLYEFGRWLPVLWAESLGGLDARARYRHRCIARVLQARLASLYPPAARELARIQNLLNHAGIARARDGHDLRRQLAASIGAVTAGR